MSVADIYDLEKAVETAAKAVLVAAGLNAYTTQDTPNFEKDRPRVEIEFTQGAGLNRWVVIDPDTGAAPTGMQPAELDLYRRESAWACSIIFSAITEADISQHAEYKVKVRNALASLWIKINEAAGMTRHAIRMTSDGGSSALQAATDKSFYLTDFTFNGKIAVQADAWPALVT